MSGRPPQLSTAALAQRFTGKVVVVTGAAGGIGLASASRFSAEGASVALVDVDDSATRKAVEELRNRGSVVEPFVCDVSSEEDVGTMVDAVMRRFGRIDVLHANAGVLLAASLSAETLERWQRTLAVNVTGVFLTVRAVLLHMVEGGGGVVVTTGSTAGIVAEDQLLGYCTSKAAVNHMTRQIAVEYAAKGIRANAVCPGWVDTSFADPLLAGLSRADIAALVAESVPMGRQGTPDEVAGVVAFLASDDARYVTGHCLVVDGGMTVK